MKYRFVGRSGIQVSTIGLGSWLTVDTHGQNISDELHQAAYENGINFFDTADVYGNGSTETMVGQSLTPFRRDTYVLATKVFFPVSPHPFPGINDRGLSRKHIFEKCDNSLRELRTDYIDLYQCHRFDDSTPLAETCRAMHDLIRQGKILYWGVSQWTADQIRHAVSICDEHNWPRPISNQPQYNMLSREVEPEVMPTCDKLGLGLVVYSPLAQGVLTGKYKRGENIPADSRAAHKRDGQWMGKVLTDENLERVEKLTSLAEGLNITVAQLSLAWVLRLKEMTSCIVGATRVSQLNDNLQAGDVELDDETLDRIKMIFGM